MKTRPNNQKEPGMSESGGMTYVEALRSEIRKEFFSKNPDIDRIMYLSEELTKKDPPESDGANMSYEEFCEKYGITIVDQKQSINYKKIIVIAATIAVVMLCSVAVIGSKFNLFELWFDDAKNRVIYQKEDGRGGDYFIGEESMVADRITVYSEEEAQKNIPFSLLVPHDLLGEYEIDNINITSIPEAMTQVEMNYVDNERHLDMQIYVIYSLSDTNADKSQIYENDYSLQDSVEIMGQQAMIISDQYNSSCTFAFDKAVYTITASKYVPVDDFKKILGSVDFLRGE